MIRCMVPTLTGPTTSRSPGRPRSDVTSLVVPVRQDVMSRTGSWSSRRSAKERTLRELISSHWTSSTASRSGPDLARARSTPRTATPTTLLPGSWSPSPEISRAADSARCWTAGRAASSDGSSPSKRSPRPAKDKAASDWLHRQVRTETPRHLRVKQSLRPNRRLADAGLTRKGQRRRTVGVVANETPHDR